MMTDIEIAQSVTPKHITEIAKIAGIDDKYVSQYGKYKAFRFPEILRDCAILAAENCSGKIKKQERGECQKMFSFVFFFTEKFFA